MVKNTEVQQEFDMFADVWKLYKALLPVQNKDDEAYWDNAVNSISEIMRKYPGQFAKDISLAVLGDLERRCRENEDQNAGRKTVS